MINYLTAEFNKLLKRKNVYIAFAFVILASIASISIYLIANSNYYMITYESLQSLLVRFASNKYVALVYVFMVTVFIAGPNGNTIKNAITIGYSRTQIYMSKIIIGSIVIFAMITASMISTFGFAGIWLNESFTIKALWESLLRYSLVLLVYLTLYIIAITLCYILNSNMLFAIVYFIIFLVFNEIIRAISTYNFTIATLSNLSLTHQLELIIHSTKDLTFWPYILGSAICYSTLSIVIGLAIVTRKDIK